MQNDRHILLHSTCHSNLQTKHFKIEFSHPEHRQIVFVGMVKIYDILMLSNKRIRMLCIKRFKLLLGYFAEIPKMLYDHDQLTMTVILTITVCFEVHNNGGYSSPM